MPHTHRDVGNLDMCARMIAAAGKTLAKWDPDQLPRLAALVADVDAAMVVAIAGQRSTGITWESIGEALGVSRQAVIMRYSARVDQLEQAS